MGLFILWLGWFGFNGSSQSALAGAVGAAAISNILVNTNLARPILGRVDPLVSLNGTIAGLVANTVEPDIVDHYWAVVIGAVGGANASPV